MFQLALLRIRRDCFHPDLLDIRKHFCSSPKNAIFSLLFPHITPLYSNPNKVITLAHHLINFRYYLDPPILAFLSK